MNPACSPKRGRGCSLFVLCSMLGGGQQEGSGHFHISTEIWEPLGPGVGQGRAAKKGWVRKPGTALLPLGRLRCCPEIPWWG